MALCDEPVIYPYFTVSHVYRDNSPIHYAFIGINMLEKHKLLFNSMSNGNIPDKSNIKILKETFGEYSTDLWVSIIEAREPILFINDRIWTDDTIFEIKTKLFIYLSKPKDKFILQPYQQLWMKINNKLNILGLSFEKEYLNLNKTELINYGPAIDSIPSIDTEFVSEDDEKLSNIMVVKEENMLLFDTINRLYSYTSNRHYNPQIFLYVLTDEIEWVQNNPILEDNKVVNKKRLWNGYFIKHWPLASFIPSSYESNLKLYSDIKNQVNIVNSVISSVRNEVNVQKKPSLEDCIILRMTLYTRPPKIENSPPYRLNMIYNFLRTQLSQEIPFIYYSRYGDKKPNISIYENSINDGSLTTDVIEQWVFKKLPSGKNTPRGRAGTIQLKIYNYTTKDGKAKYETLTLFQNSELTILLSFEEYTESSVKDIENAIDKVTKIIKTLNNDFLIYHNHPLYSVPILKIKDGEFVFSDYTFMQFYEVNTTFKTKEMIDFNKFLIFIQKYKSFVDTSFFKDNKTDNTNLNMKYNRISKFIGLPIIFEYIDKESLVGTTPDAIVDLIIKRFGKARSQATELYNDWRILTTNKQVAKELLKRPGVNIDLKKSFDFITKEDTDETGKLTYKYKISIKGLKTLFVLRNCYSFLQTVISLYFNPIKEKQTLKNKLLFQKDIQLDFGISNSNIIVSDINDIKQNKDLNNIELAPTNVNNIDFNTNNTNTIKLETNDYNSDNINKKENFDFSSTGNVNMSNEKRLDSKIKLKCSKEENKIIEKGTCKDVCDFPKFKLNRLQHFEPKIFKFKAKSKSYSRQCEEARRPIIVTDNIFKNPKLDKKSFTYSIKYKSSSDGPEYNYICPQAWCPICEIPISLDKLKNIKTKNTKDGPCEYALCPNGKHDVIINRKGSKYIYPGFQQAVGNPDGFCMPCCFIKDQRDDVEHQRCSNIKSNDDTNKDDLGKKYISRRDKIPLSEGRFGLLPEDIEIFLEQSTCFPGNIKNGFDCLVRKGVSLSSKSTSFLNVIIDLVSEIYKEKISRKSFMEKITSSLTPHLFKSLSSGLITRIFKVEKNYINYLLDPSSNILDIYIWDIVSRPGIFVKEGFNIIIFTPHSIHCPFGQDVNELYSFNKKTLLMVKFTNTYEPIYRVQYNDSKLNVIFLQNSTEPSIQKILNYVKNGCQKYDEIDWNSIAKINVKEEASLQKTLDELKDKYNIKLQITDSYSKTTAIILNNDLYVPVKPSKIDMNYPYLETYSNSDIPILSLDTTLKYLNELIQNTKLPLTPIYLIVYKKDTNLVVGVLLETNRIVPVIPIKLSKIKKTKLEVSNKFYYPYADSKNIKDESKKERLKVINEYQYKNEAFERFKYEISRYLQTPAGKQYKDKIIKLIRTPNISNISKKDIDSLKNIILKLTSILVASPSDSKKKIKDVIESGEKYNSRLLRRECFENNKITGNEDSHCVCKGNKCKLVSLIKTDFTKKILDILLRYPIQREEILNGTISMIDLSTSLLKVQNGEILLTGNKIDEEFNKLIYTDKKKFQLKLLRDVDMQQPTFEGVSKKDYLKLRKGTEKDIKTYSVIDLSQHWISISDPSFRLVSTKKQCDSLYYIFSELSVRISNKYLNSNSTYVEREYSNIKEITYNNIRDIYANFLLHINSDEIKKISKTAIPSITDTSLNEIVDVSDFYNIYNEKEKINSVDELTGRIKLGFPVYKPSKFDVVMLAYMLNINVILLRTSISELIGQKLDNLLYAVLFYDPLNKDTCIRFYLLQSGAIPYLTTLNSKIKRLLPTKISITNN